MRKRRRAGHVLPARAAADGSQPHGDFLSTVQGLCEDSTGAVAQPCEHARQTGHSILLLGRPGVGKTTMLRETARVLADDLAKRVIIVDTSNEIAGDGDIPHPAIGRARRMQVGTQILSGLKSDGRGGYKGRAYVPRHKVHATATVRHAGPDALIVKGCTFGGVICKSERWTRVN